MIIDLSGDILTACRILDNETMVATCDFSKIQKSGGKRYVMARD